MAVLKYLDKADQDRIEQLCSELCDKFCKYPHEVYDDEQDINTVCESCPLNEIERITGATE